MIIPKIWKYKKCSKPPTRIGMIIHNISEKKISKPPASGDTLDGRTPKHQLLGALSHDSYRVYEEILHQLIGGKHHMAHDLCFFLM